jgi:hypothetical protein
MVGNRFSQPRPPRGGCQTGSRPPGPPTSGAPDWGGRCLFAADLRDGPALACNPLIQKENARSRVAPGAFR